MKDQIAADAKKMLAVFTISTQARYREPARENHLAWDLDLSDPPKYQDAVSPFTEHGLWLKHGASRQ